MEKFNIMNEFENYWRFNWWNGATTMEKTIGVVLAPIAAVGTLVAGPLLVPACNSEYKSECGDIPPFTAVVKAEGWKEELELKPGYGAFLVNGCEKSVELQVQAAFSKPSNVIMAQKPQFKPKSAEYQSWKKVARLFVPENTSLFPYSKGNCIDVKYYKEKFCEIDDKKIYDPDSGRLAWTQYEVGKSSVEFAIVAEIFSEECFLNSAATMLGIGFCCGEEEKCGRW